MRPDVAVGSIGRAYPDTVKIDSNNRISFFSEKGEFLTRFTPQDINGPLISYTRGLPVCDWYSITCNLPVQDGTPVPSRY